MIEFGMLEGQPVGSELEMYSMSDQLRSAPPVDVPLWSWSAWFGTPYTAADALSDAGAYVWGGVTKAANSTLETVKDTVRGAGAVGGDFFGSLVKPVYPLLIMVAVIGLIAFLVLGRVQR